jgi:hypothetical protein
MNLFVAIVIVVVGGGGGDRGKLSLLPSVQMK